jgi:hypothetical protein
MTMGLQIIRNGDSRYKVSSENGKLVGFVHKWHKQDGALMIARFRAVPIGQPDHDCASLSSAIKYLEAFE